MKIATEIAPNPTLVSVSILIALLSVFAISGCDGDREADIKLTDYKCTMEQLKLVDIEYEICDRSSYMSSHCFATAKKTYCDRVDVVGI